MLINLDNIANLVKANSPEVDVKGVVDAGWFMDNYPYGQQQCGHPYRCPPIIGVQLGSELVNLINSILLFDLFI